MLGARIVGRVPIGRVALDSQAVLSPFVYLLDNPEGDRRHIVEVTAYDPDAAATHTHRYADDDMRLGNANGHFRPTILSLGAYTSSIDIENVTSGSLQVSFGDISVSLDEEDLDETRGDHVAFYDHYFDCRPYTVKLGNNDFTYAEFGTIRSGKVRDAEWGDRGGTNVLTFKIQDALMPLEQPASQSTYAGTGDIEGDETLKGVRRPLAFGECKHVLPQLIDPVKNVYQWHDGDSSSLDGAFDNGFALTDGGSKADVFAYTVTTDDEDNFRYFYELDRSLVRLSVPAIGILTLNVKGESTAALGGYVDKTASVAERVARRNSIADTDFDQSTRVQVDSQLPYTIGYFQPSGVNDSMLTVMQKIMAAAWSFVGGSRAGLIRFGRVGLGDVQANRVIREHRVLSLVRRAPAPSAKSLALGYNRSWTVIDRGAIAPNAAESVKIFLEKSLRRLEPEVDAPVTDDRLHAKEYESDTIFIEEGDAQLEQTRRFDLMKVLRHYYTADVVGELHRIEAGHVVKLYYTKFGFTQGKSFVVRRVSDNIDTGVTTLELWG